MNNNIIRIDNIKEIEQMLLNIENLDEKNLKILKNSIIDYKLINASENYIDIYNKMNEQQIKKLIELVGPDALSIKLISSFKNFSWLIVPYSYNISYFYSEVFNDQERAIEVLNNDVFYQSLRSLDLDNIFKTLPNDELKKIYINYCLKNKFDLIFNECEFNLFDKSFTTYILNMNIDNLILKHIIETDNSSQIIFLFRFLSSESQMNIFKNDWFKNKIYINDLYFSTKLMENCKNDNLIESIASDINSATLLDEYGTTKKIIFLKLFIDKADVNDYVIPPILRNIFIIKNEAYDNLEEKYKNKLNNYINNLSSNVILELFFEFYVYNEKYSTIYNILFNKVCNVLNTEHKMIDKLCSGIINSSDRRLLDLVINHVSKEDLLLLAIRNNYINNYVFNILKENPNYFQGIVITDNNKFSIPSEIDEKQINNYLKIIKYLDKNQYNIFFKEQFLNNNKDLKNYYLKSVLSNPNNLDSLQNIELFSNDKYAEIINGIEIDNLIRLILLKKIPLNNEYFNKIMDTRLNEIVQYINSDELNKNATTYNFFDKIRIILYVFSPENREIFLNSINNVDFLLDLNITVFGKKLTNIIYNRISNLFNNNIDYIKYYTSLPSFMDDKDSEQFLSKINNNALIRIVSFLCLSNKGLYSNTFYINEFYKRLDNNFDILFTDIVTIMEIDNLLMQLPESYQLKIKNYIDNKYDKLISKYPVFKDYLNNYTSKANYIYSLENNLLNDTNYQIVLNMLNKNNSIFNSIDFRLLNNDFYKMGNYFLDKVSRYPYMAIKIYNIYKNNPAKYNLICLLSNKIFNENTSIIYDRKIEIIINYLNSNDISFNGEINDQLLNNIENYILENYFNSIKYLENVSIDNYIEEKNNLLDNYIENCNNINDLQKYLYQKYFCIDEKEIEKFLISYAYNYKSVEEFSNSDLPLIYINSILSIRNCNNILELKNNTLHQFTISDYLKITGMMIEAYNKSIIQDLKNMDSGNPITITINNQTVPATELIDNFGIFGHSTCAYNQMPIINNDYYDSWNLNPNTLNNGICTFFMTNSSYGTPDVKDTGIMVGFKNIIENSIPLMAPYDLGSENSNFNLKSHFNPFFARLKELSDFNRHTHSESVFKRRITDAAGNTYLRQPDIIIIFEDMPDSIKANSIKAYNDFKKHGINLEIKYIDRVKVCHNESRKLESKINEFLVTNDLKVFSDIINLYESNICGCDFIGNKYPDKSLNLINPNELFFTDKITNLLYKVIDELEQSNDINRINKFINIMELEQFKFDLIKDFNPNRRHTFDLYTKDMRDRVIGLKEKVKEINNQIKK